MRKAEPISFLPLSSTLFSLGFRVRANVTFAIASNGKTTTSSGPMPSNAESDAIFSGAEATIAVSDPPIKPGEWQFPQSLGDLWWHDRCFWRDDGQRRSLSSPSGGHRLRWSRRSRLVEACDIDAATSGKPRNVNGESIKKACLVFLSFADISFG